jgi:osmotically-inducible protein OsmY
MNISGKKVILSVWVSLASGIGGLGAFATPVVAQTAVATAVMPSAPALAAGELQRRVQTALHDDPYLYDKHVTVSVERGNVVLRGFVLSSFDLLDALRIARKAAGDNRVVDDLSIELDGQSGRH